MLLSVSLQHLAQVGPIIEFDPQRCNGIVSVRIAELPAPEPGIDDGNHIGDLERVGE